MIRQTKNSFENQVKPFNFSVLKIIDNQRINLKIKLNLLTEKQTQV